MVAKIGGIRNPSRICLGASTVNFLEPESYGEEGMTYWLVGACKRGRGYALHSYESGQPEWFEVSGAGPAELVKSLAKLIDDAPKMLRKLRAPEQVVLRVEMIGKRPKITPVVVHREDSLDALLG